MAATGLPIPKSGDVSPQPISIVDGDRLSNAASWQQIAHAGEKLQTEAAGALRQEVHRVDVAAKSQIDVDVRRRRLDAVYAVRDDPNPPAAFEAKWKGIGDGLLSETETRYVDHYRHTLGAEGNAGYAALQAEKYATDKKLGHDNWSSNLQQSTDDLLSLANAGVPLDSAQGTAAVAKLQGVLNSGVGYFIAENDALRRLENVKAQATVHLASGKVTEAYGNGDVAAARKVVETITRDPSLPLSLGQRDGLGNRLNAKIHAMEADRTASLAPVQQEAAAILSARANGERFSQADTDTTIERFKKFGGLAEAARFQRDLLLLDTKAHRAQLPLADHAAALLNDRARYGRIPNAGNASADVRSAIDEAGNLTGVPTSYLYRVAGKESGFNPAAQASTSSAGGLFQFTDRTWAATVARHGDKYGIAPGTPKTDARANALMAAEFTKENADALKAEGLPVTDGNLYLAHFAGAGDAVKLLTADSNARAALILPAAANANRGIFYNRDGSARTVQQVVGRLTSGFGGVPVEASPAEIKFVGEQNKALHGRVSTEIDAIITDMGKPDGALPNQQRLNDVLIGAQAVNDPGLYRKAADAFQEWNIRRRYGAAPPAVLQARINALRQKGTTEGLSEDESADLTASEKVYAASEKGLREDALTFGIKANSETIPKVPGALNLGDRNEFQRGVAERAALAARFTEQYKIAPVAALGNAEAAQVRLGLDTSDARGQARIYSDILAAIPDERTRLATLAKLGSEGPQAMVRSIAGSLMGTDPRAAELILSGQGLSKPELKFVPKVEDYRDDLNKLLPPAAFSRASVLAGDSGAFSVMRQATLAVYAGLSARANDNSGTFDPKRMAEAVQIATGGLVTHNGRQVIAPYRGAPQSAFDALMAGVKDSDLGGVTTLNGTPITATYLRANAQLESVGQGQYLVRIGPGENPYAVVGATTGFGASPFVLDLRNIAPGKIEYDKAPEGTRFGFSAAPGASQRGDILSRAPR